MKLIQKCCIGAFFLIGGLFYVMSESLSATDYVENDPKKQEERLLDEIVATTSIPTMIMTEETLLKRIVVHVCGCVQTPGVYELNEGSRLIDAVTLAGGFTKEAAQDFVNQAMVIVDGQKIEIPSVEEVKAGFVVEDPNHVQTESGTDKRININLATKEELMTLPGIGEAKAQSIIAYRNENHGFQSIDDIQQIAGIKEAIYSKVKDLITVD